MASPCLGTYRHATANRHVPRHAIVNRRVACGLGYTLTTNELMNQKEKGVGEESGGCSIDQREIIQNCEE